VYEVGFEAYVSAYGVPGVPVAVSVYPVIVPPGALHVSGMVADVIVPVASPDGALGAV
jgi:hypothetical protein